MSDQQKLLIYTQKKVENFFSAYPVPAHGFDHVRRVAVSAKQIALGENARSVFLCELAGLLHDIGRVPEHFEGKKGGHHILSYELLREWYRHDKNFDALSTNEKKELLYAVRYHWNDQADDYDTAWILRDADKLDAFGDIGIQRVFDFHNQDERKAMQELRYQYQMFMHVRTATAKKIIADNELFEKIENFMAKKLQQAVVPVEL